MRTEVLQTAETINFLEHDGLPVANPRHRLDSMQMRKFETGFGLSLRVGAQNIRFNKV